MQQEQKSKKMSTGKKVLWAAIALAAAAVIFFAGFFTYYFTLPAGARSLLWMKDKIDSEYYEDVDDGKFWQAAIDGATSLLDRYSAYYTADEYDVVVDSSRGISQGMGLSFFLNSNMVAEAALGSPAFYAGLETGIFVTGAGEAEDAVENTFTASEKNGETVYDYSRLSKLLSGFAVGDTAYLRVSAVSGHETAEENCKIVPVTLARYTESYVLYAAGGEAYMCAYEGGSGVWTNVSEYVSVDEKVSGGTAYIRLTSFYGNAVEEFGRAAQAYREDGKHSLLLDLRNDGGGSVSVMQGIAAYLMRGAESDSEPVMRAVYGNGREEVYRAGGNYYSDYFSEEDTIYVAANANTASASEALMGVMLSYDTIEYGNIFITDLSGGTQAARTYGKGIMQTTFRNPLTGEAVKLTTATIHWPDEASTCIHDRGITTDDGAIPTEDAQTFGDWDDAELRWILSEIAA